MALTTDQLGSWVDVGLKVLAATGLFVYATVRIGIDGFYRTFEVTAEEVGLTQSTIIGRAAIYLLIIVGASATALTLSLLPFLFLPEKDERVAEATYYILLWAFLLLAIAWSFRWAWKAWEGSWTHSLFLTFALLLLLVGFGVMVDLIDDGTWFLGLPLTFFGLGSLAWVAGQNMALVVASGREISGRVFNLRAFEVAVVWTDADFVGVVDDSRPYLFLGQGERWLILFDAAALETIRIPSGKVSIVSTRLDALARQFALPEGGDES